MRSLLLSSSLPPHLHLPHLPLHCLPHRDLLIFIFLIICLCRRLLPVNQFGDSLPAGPVQVFQQRDGKKLQQFLNSSSLSHHGKGFEIVVGAEEKVLLCFLLRM